MAKLQLYTPGHLPQYGKARWARYENLRVRGFNKQEARTLSRAVSPQAQSVVTVMAQTRSRLVSRFAKTHALTGLNQRQISAQFSKFARDWYNNNKLTSAQGRQLPPSKGGKPDLMVWYNREENRAARKRGWKPGGYAGEGEDAPRRRNKAVTPLHKGKGNVKSQKARARVRSKNFDELVQGTGDSALDRQHKRQWIRDLRATAKKFPSREPQLLKQAQRLGFAGKLLIRNRR